MTNETKMRIDQLISDGLLATAHIVELKARIEELTSTPPARLIAEQSNEIGELKRENEALHQHVGDFGYEIPVDELKLLATIAELREKVEKGHTALRSHAEEIQKLQTAVDLARKTERLSVETIRSRDETITTLRATAREYIEAHKLMRVRFQDAADAEAYTKAGKRLEEMIDG